MTKMKFKDLEGTSQYFFFFLPGSLPSLGMKRDLVGRSINFTGQFVI
jgi:hypothetical protein